MKKHQELKYYFSIITLFACLFIFSNNVLAQKKSEVLIPYFKNEKWGLCTKDKVVKVPAIYESLTYYYPYFFATHDTSGTTQILSINGKLIDSFSNEFRQIGKDSFVLYNYLKKYPSTDKDTNNAYLHQDGFRFTLHLLHNNKVVPLSNGAIEVYKLNDNKFLVSPEFTRFLTLDNKEIIGFTDDRKLGTWDYNGKKLKNNPNYSNKKIERILSNGNYIIPSLLQEDGNKNTQNDKMDLMSSKGRKLLSACKNLSVVSNTEIIVCDEPRDTLGLLHSLYDFNGKLLLKNIRTFNHYFTNLISVYSNEYQHLVGLYNYQTHRFIWKSNYPGSVRIKLFTDMVIPKIEVDTMTYFLDDQGNKLVTLGKYNKYYKKVNQLMKKLSVFKPKQGDQPNQTKEYIAIRPNKDVPFQIFNAQYQKVKEMDDFLGGSNQEVYAFKKDGKWGLADFDNVILKPDYDTIQLTKSYSNYLMTKNGVNFIYLTKAKKMFPATGYDDAIGYANHNYYLGIKYLDTLKRGEDSRFIKQLKSQLSLIDSVGNTVYSKVVEPTINLNYALTENNKIMEYAEDNRHNYFYVFDVLHGDSIRIEKKFMGFEDYHGLPVLMKFYTDKGTELFMVNNQQEIKHKIGESVFFKSEPAQFYNQSDTVNCIKLIEISKVQNPDFMKLSNNMEEMERNMEQGMWIRTEKEIGYISVDGVFYAD